MRDRLKLLIFVCCSLAISIIATIVFWGLAEAYTIKNAVQVGLCISIIFCTYVLYAEYHWS